MKFLSLLVVVMGVSVFAAMPVEVSALSRQIIGGAGSTDHSLRNWKVGDSVSYNIDIASFIRGTFSLTIKSIDALETILVQTLDIGDSDNTVCVISINSATGEVNKLVCNGEEQPIEVASESDVTIVEQKKAKVTVPAGTFQSTYTKYTSEGFIGEEWSNPDVVPIVGLVKSVEPSAYGATIMELVSYKKN